MAASFSGVTARDFGLMAKLLLHSLHLALEVPQSVFPCLMTGSAFPQWGQ
jgi:hypothetical protein